MEPQEFQPAPTSPEQVQGIPANGQPAALSQGEMRANLQSMMDKIDEKYQGFQTDKFSYDNQKSQAKSQVLREIFDLLQSAGIDPSNIEQVQQFLDQIKQSNPELYEQVSKVLQDIISEDSEEGVIPGGIENPPINMNINNTNDQPSQNV